jgi:hypothetical protein
MALKRNGWQGNGMGGGMDGNARHRKAMEGKGADWTEDRNGVQCRATDRCGRGRRG